MSEVAEGTDPGGSGSGSDRGGGGSNPSSTSAESQTCEVCNEFATNPSPFSGRQLCFNHVLEELNTAREMNISAVDLIQPYMESAGAMKVLMKQEEQKLLKQKENVNKVFDAMQASINEWGRRSIQSLTACSNRLKFIEETRQLADQKDLELAEAKQQGDKNRIVELINEINSLRVQQMAQTAIAEQEYANGPSSDEAVQRQLGQLTRASALLSSQLKKMGIAGANASAARTMFPKCHTIQFDDRVEWVAACPDSSGFYGNSDSRVVSIADLTSSGIDDPEAAGCTPLPEPCLVARVRGCSYLSVLSTDGAVRLSSHCQSNQWQEAVCGLHCDRQLLFVGQKSSVTVTDLSGRLIRVIPAPDDGFAIRGIGGNSHGSLYLSSGNKIAVMAKATGQLQTMITLDEIPDAELRSVAFHQDCLLAADMRHGKVYRLLADSPHTVLVAHPTKRTGLDNFHRPLDAAVDSRNRLYISESGRDAIRVVSAGTDGASLCSIESEPAPRGGTEDRPVAGFPCGLAIVPAVPGGARLSSNRKELLVVADLFKKQLVVYKIR
ncbi:hypothetical protein BOX15_Mlig004503g1 [Macrostomum lignano]|uniref:Uncharacterized protein n=2 Tax=Macrostomum lignano TaxID=282301 RepID=A0A267DE53_9PLAT|nr:hypothetical protein BOX15_Mlig004503g1 [Macrostomum lignano]